MAQFNLTYDLNVTLKQRLGFEMAALIWSQYLTDDTNINLHISAVDSLNDAAAVGGAVPIFHEAHYGVYQAYLALDASSEADDSALGTLQEGNTVDVWLDEELVDGNSTLMLTRAQAKALGMDEALPLANGGAWTHDILQDPDALDGYILINNSYNWNYDLTREAETPEGELDFLTMALHELGHSLGFVSGLDGLIETFELHSGETRTEGFTPLDLLRYSDASATIENPDGAVSDLSLGAAAYFSLDGGVTALAEFEAGDKYQASHWQRFQSAIGIMDPTLGYQERTNISQLDLQAFDALGWDVNYSMLQDGLNLNALYDDALRAISQNFGVGVAAVESAVETGQDWYTLGYGQWWQAFKDQVVEMGYGQCWQEFEAEMLKIGYGSWWQAFDQDLLEMGYGGWWQAFEAQVLEMGYGGWWQAFEAQVFKDQIIEMGYGQWWQEFEANLIKMGYGSWWQALDSDLLEIGYGGWWQAFEAQVLAMGYGGWWQQFEPQMLEIGYGGWWQKFEPQMLEMSYGGWWQVFEQQMLAMGYGGWWQEFEANLLELGYGSWWQAFESQVLEMGYGSWWQIFEEKILEMGYGSWWQQFEGSLLEMGYGAWWQAFEMGYGDWWQQIEQHIDEIKPLEDTPSVTDSDGAQTVVSGGAKDDILAGGQDQDLVSGAAGDDLIDGKGGNDILLGDAGNDIVYGWQGEDDLFGGDGDDLLAGENGNDKLYGDAGHDILSGGRGDDQLDGGDGRDVLKGDMGNDRLDGGAGDDQLRGGAGADLLVGGMGQDTVTGGKHDDVLYGDAYVPTGIISTDFANEPLDIDPTNNGATYAGETLDFWMRLEAEDMRLSNYIQDNQADASGRSVIVTRGNNGQAKTTFSGPSGSYNLVLGFSDAAGGTSEITVAIKREKGDGPNPEYTFQLDGEAGAGAYQIEGVTLNAGDRIVLKGKADGDDMASLDYLDILTPGVNPTFDKTGAPTGKFYNLVEGRQRSGETTRLEAEVMDLAGGYSTFRDPYTSGNMAIANTGNQKGEATHTYTGQSGIYNLYANYFDSSAGEAKAEVFLNGKRLARWEFGQDDNASHERLLGLNVTLNQGDVIQIQGDAEDGDQASIDYLLLEHISAAESFRVTEAGATRAEVEQMTLTGDFKIEDGKSFASGAAIVKSEDETTGFTASTEFTGATGLYDIVIGYYDADNGLASYTASLAGSELATWQSALDLGDSSASEKSFITRTLQGVLINNGDALSLQSIKESGDKGYLDYVEFLPHDPHRPIRVEAEHMQASGDYEHKAYDFTSSSRTVRSKSDDVDKTVNLSTAFEGKAGTYNIVVGYYDENDGSAQFSASVNGAQHASWIADQDLGDNDVAMQTFTTYTIADVELNPGDAVLLTSLRQDGDEAHVDYIEFVTNQQVQSNRFQIEVEQMDLSGHAKIKNESFAHGGGFVETGDGITGFTGTTLFTGETGYYDIVVGYYDDNDGSAEMAIKVDHKALGRWYADQDLGSNKAEFQTFTTHTVAQGVRISTMDLVEISGIEEGGDKANLDYIQFIAVDPPPLPPSTPKSQGASDNGDMIRGGAGNDTAYGGEGDDLIYGDTGDDILYGDFGVKTVGNHAPETLTFQQGLNGYLGAIDTQLHGGAPTTEYSNAASINVDGADGGNLVQGLIQFEHLFGGQSGQIGLNDTINSAVLELNVTSQGNSLEIYELLQSWTDASTWNSWNNGVQADGVEAKTTPVAVTSFVSTGILSIDVTASLQAWQADPTANHGWAFLPTGVDGVDFDSAEGGDAPRLLVDVSTPVGGNDQLTGGSGNDILNGGEGNDILNGSNKIALGLNEQDTLSGGGGSDRFILGNAGSAYYHQGGDADFVIIQDFDLGVDTVQLFGSSTDYSQTAQGANTLLYWQGQDLVAQFNSMTSLDLSHASFQFVG